VGTKPKVVTALSDTKVTGGRDVTLRCEIRAGEPRASCRWFKDAKEIYGGSRKHTLAYTDDFATLTIHGAELADAATYRCEADNKVGRVDTQATLTVMGTLCFLCLCYTFRML
jgi:hypothetical protein